MTKIVYNACYGGFSLSEAAVARGRVISGIPTWGDWSGRNLSRTDPVLIQVIEELGKAADGRRANLVIVELPPGTEYRIEEYDGLESVETKDSYVWEIA